MFSSRLRHAAGRNRIALALDARRAAGLPVIDLTLSNPTQAGFMYPTDLLHPLAHERALCYEPRPFGLPAARQAVSEDFARRGVRVPASQVVLTASTSEAYSMLFKLLCDPGDAVLAPRPSYPLVEHLTELDGVFLEQYSLEFHGEWTIDPQILRERLSVPSQRRVRAVIMINPNNPTGSVTKAAELDAIASLAAEHELALISDEVFGDYPMAEGTCASALAQQTALTFALGGLSKSIGLPQAKLGWIGIGGPASLVAHATERLETICDAYLSVSTPVQAAAAELLSAGATVREQIRRRVRENYASMVEFVSALPSCTVLPAEAGWYAIVQVPVIEPEETLVLELLERTGVLVHPGFFFDFEREAYLVMSLLPERAVFEHAVHAIVQEIGRIR
ncbi:MAG TPA: pyridoxal phosphate-dependent aminotransferase [Vicinamibacterales bacterium]|nr:pyridoxal phosphate-dependent aminotransferase [Vicinamibacterales bacterium]